MGKIKVGVFGARRGMSMGRVYLQHPDAELVALCDKYEPALKMAELEAEKYGKKISCYTSFAEFFEHDMDAVVLANYATEHVPYAVQLLRSGRHILSEVPASETMAQAVELIEAVEETGLVYAFAENVSYKPTTFEMQRLYQKGDLGEVMYAEGEYIHDGANISAQITYGDKNHWRFRNYATFYCTHSIGPILTITGRRPVQVVGFTTNEADWMRQYGSIKYPGIELVTLDNGSILRSIHGPLKRSPYGCRFLLYGKKGMMETDRFDDETLHVYREGEIVSQGEFSHYKPSVHLTASTPQLETGHGNADLGAPHFFIEKILDRPDGHKYSIDVYTGVDMSICGILAYRSILAGNKPVPVPNLRKREERDQYRNDHACTTPSVAGEQLLPVTPYPEDEPIPEETYAYVKQLWQEYERKNYQF